MPDLVLQHGPEPPQMPAAVPTLPGEEGAAPGRDQPPDLATEGIRDTALRQSRGHRLGTEYHGPRAKPGTAALPVLTPPAPHLGCTRSQASRAELECALPRCRACRLGGWTARSAAPVTRQQIYSVFMQFTAGLAYCRAREGAEAALPSAELPAREGPAAAGERAAHIH